MKTILLILFLVACPCLLGYGAVTIYNSIAGLFKKNSIASLSSSSIFSRFATWFPAGSLILLLIAGGTNLIAVFLDMSITSAMKLFAVLTICATTVCYAVMLLFRVKNVLKSARNISNTDVASDDCKMKPNDSINKTKATSALIVFSIIFSIALLVIAALDRTYYQGDQLIETVNSFLFTDKIYSVNPLTGLEYANGYPARLKIQSLPLFYTIIAKAFDVNAYVLLCNIMPVFWLLNGMCCFYRMGEGLWSNSFTKRFGNKSLIIIFYDICVFLLICCDVAYMTTGFDAFHAGYRAGNILALLIVNWMLGTCLKKRWAASFLAVVVEPLVASSLVGFGACVIIFAGMLIATKIYTTRFESKVEAKEAQND